MQDRKFQSDSEGNLNALIAQLDRAFDYGSKGYGFDSYWARQLILEGCNAIFFSYINSKSLILQRKKYKKRKNHCTNKNTML